jgi:molecular chaperone GrpE
MRRENTVETDMTNGGGAPVDAAAEAAADGAETADLAALGAKLAAANARADESEARLLYALADFENLKKRSERTLHERVAAGRRATLGKFLPVLDNLDRALRYECDSDGLRGGLEATRREFEALLTSEGVQRLSLVGRPFDPRVAEAIGTSETDDVDEDIVVEEAEPGYALGDDVLRPARVIVAKKRGSDPDRPAA